MLYKSTDQGNDVMAAPFVFLFLARTILQETSTETDDKTINVIVKKRIDNNFPWSVLLSTIEMTSKCSKRCSMVDKSTDIVKLFSTC